MTVWFLFIKPLELFFKISKGFIQGRAIGENVGLPKKLPVHSNPTHLLLADRLVLFWIGYGEDQSIDGAQHVKTLDQHQVARAVCCGSPRLKNPGSDFS